MHESVLLHEAVDGLNVRRGKVVVDATLGAGGHSRLICERLGGAGRLIGIDADRTTLLRAAEFAGQGGCELIPVLGNFRDLTELLSEVGISEIDGIIFDLGVRSNQLEGSARGFSFRAHEPLRMTFAADASAEATTALDVVNRWSEEHIADILRGFGEEKYANRIASAIVRAREAHAIEYSDDLGVIVWQAVPHAHRHGRIHPATRTFQAIRMAVNDELGALQSGLSKGWSVLRPHGRMSVISFHSIEDRIVKQFFKEREIAGEAVRITKKPIVPMAEEIARNPRSRSAKLRVCEKIDI
ncbi:MAG: 16S rRNA (cytosine(1402)-N(4))-methyltransferase RsmH [Candidatus Vogelbacteria bacterium]|nr:16S rRNA (cytosine(1402)-N(4))-methyltransferase RsmH [Candidatus Vogelbacteria bacterium]